MTRHGKTMLGIVMACGLCGPASADELRLKNGQAVQGIVTNQTPSHVTIQVVLQGFVTIERHAITAVIQETSQKHEALLAQWRKDHEADLDHERRQLAIEADLRAQGLVKYRGEWVAPGVIEAERVRVQAEEEARARRDLESKLAEVTSRLQRLEQENQSLQQELARREVVVVPQPVFVDHRFDRWPHDRRNRGHWHGQRPRAGHPDDDHRDARHHAYAYLGEHRDGNHPSNDQQPSPP